MEYYSAIKGNEVQIHATTGRREVSRAGAEGVIANG